MPDVERLLSQYIEEHRAGGEADPLAFLDRLEGTDRAELAALIDAYLAHSPGRAWDSEAFHGSSAGLLTERLMRSFGGEAGIWPVVLPRLRERAQVLREEIARRLADALGVADKREKVAFYYHEMEQGLLPAEQVDERVTDRLAEILGTSAEFLRRAGRSPGGAAAPGGPAAVFTRTTAAREARLEAAEEEAAPASRAPEPAEAEWDEVDRLFRGGRG